MIYFLVAFLSVCSIKLKKLNAFMFIHKKEPIAAGAFIFERMCTRRPVN